MKHNFPIILIFFVLAFTSCKKEEKDSNEDPASQNNPRLNFRFVFDEDQDRLDNFGNPEEVPPGNAAQSPDFQKISAHYIELIPHALVALGGGEVLYKAPETNAGGDWAIDFDQSILVGENEVFFSTPISQVEPGSYEYLRVSLAFQQYGIDFLFSGLDLEGTLASFIGYNTYIGTYTIENESMEVNANKLQGYWGFETVSSGILEGQAPEGATTVVNPISSSSPIPAGSCVVTGNFTDELVITGNETSDINVTVSLSTNQSFEWVEVNEDGKYEPAAGETVTDMGIRGMVPSWE